MAHRKKPPKVIVADCSGSTCFSDLRWKDGVAFATFARDGSQYEFDVDRETFKEWADDASLGQWFNAELN